VVGARRALDVPMVDSVVARGQGSVVSDQKKEKRKKTEN